MPNWVMSRIEFDGKQEDVDRAFEAFKPKYNEAKGVIDFNEIVTMPDSVFRGNLSMEDREKYPGDLNWYDWCCNHWGTKWNAHDGYRDGNLLEFTTAWSAPFPIYKEIAMQNPGVSLHVLYSDEDIGTNCGEVYCCLEENGYVEHIYEFEDFSEEAKQTAIEVWGVEEDFFDE